MFISPHERLFWLWHNLVRLSGLEEVRKTETGKMTKGGIFSTESAPDYQSVCASVPSWPMSQAVQMKKSERIATVLHWHSQPGFKGVSTLLKIHCLSRKNRLRAGFSLL